MRNPVLIGAMTMACVGASCGGSPMPGGHMGPTGPTASSSMTGSWTGSVGDSTGSMMGAGLAPSMMEGAGWVITQTGTTFAGTMAFPGYHGGQAAVSGTIDGARGTFTMTMPAGTMMMAGCAALAAGTFDMDAAMEQIHGEYAGSNTCTGSFGDGRISLGRR